MVDETIVSLLIDLTGNPWGKALFTVLFYMIAVANAKGIGGVQKATYKWEAKRDHLKRIKRYTARKVRMLKDRFWKMVKVFDRMTADSSVDLGKGHSSIKYSNKYEYKRDYFEEARKILLEVKLDELVYDMDVEANTFKTAHDRDEFINDYSRDFRELLLSDIHKRVGHDDRVDSIEDAYIPYEYIRSMVESVLTEVEKSNNIMECAIAEIEKKYSVSTFDIIKVFQTIKGRSK